MEKSIWAKKPEGKEFEVIEPGNYMARCYSMIALGTHITEYDGKQKEQEKVYITWELPTEKMSDGRPFVVGKRYTLSMFESSNLRKDLENWRGRKFTDEEAENFDIVKVLDIPCLLNIVHSKPNDKGYVYANIATISPLAKGMECPSTINEIQVITTEDYDEKTIATLPKFIQEIIKDSLEYKGETNEVIDIDAIM